MSVLSRCIFLALTLVVFTFAGTAAAAQGFLIDVRTPAEFSEGHLQGALNIAHDKISEAIVASGIKKNDKVILYCRSGRRSAIAAESLRRLGFTQVEDYGGMDDARKRLSGGMKP